MLNVSSETKTLSHPPAHSLYDFLNRKRAPLVVYLELTHRCSFLCVHCYIPEELRWPNGSRRGEPKGLSTEEIKRLMRELKAAGTLFLVLTGGEVFLRRDLGELLDYASQLKFAVKLYSNGFHITDAWAKRIRDLSLYGVEISLYGATEATYYKITKVRGGFARTVAAIRRLRDLGVRVIVKTPVLSLNVQEIAEIKQLAESCGAIFRYDLVIIPRFDGDQAPYDYRCSDEEIYQLLEQLDPPRLAEAKPRDRAPGCSVGKWSAVVSPEGEVLPCIEMRNSIGNVRDKSFGEIWQQNPHMQRIRERLAAMPANPEVFGDGLCGHCPAFSLHTEGDMTKPSKEHQRIRDVKRRLMLDRVANGSQ